MTTSGTFYVYEHWRLDRDECFYVGKGRGGRAYSMKNRNRHHQAIVAKLSRIGSAFEVRMVSVGLDEQAAFELEKERIQFWRDAKVDLTNLTDGGEGMTGFKHSQETKKLWSEQRKGKTLSIEERKKRSDTLKGRPKTKEHAASAGAAGGLARRGKKQTADWIAKRVNTMKKNGTYKRPELQKPVICITNDMEFKSVTEAANYFSLPKDYVSANCRGARKYTKNLIFKFKEVA